MATKARELTVFAWLPEKPIGRFVPAGLFQLTELAGANPNNREITSRFAYGLGYLNRPEAVEVDPVSLSLILQGRKPIKYIFFQVLWKMIFQQVHLLG